MPTEEPPASSDEPDADTEEHQPAEPADADTEEHQPAEKATAGSGGGDAKEAATAEQAVAPAHHHRRRRVLVASILALATVIGVFAVLAVWANRQILSSENWTTTSSELLAAPKVQAVLGNFLSTEAFDAVPIEKELEKVLPAKVRGLAGPATAGLRSLADQFMPQFLASAAVQEAWREANMVAHAQLIKLLEGGGPALSSSHGEVVLHLKPLVEELAAQLGLSHQLHELQEKLNGTPGEVAKLKAESKLKEVGITPPQNGEIVLMKSDQLAAAQDVV